MKTLAITAASIGLALSATPALASQDEARTQQVSVAGLDLNSSEGQRMLDRRIEKAARAVCEAEGFSTGSRTRSSAERECLTRARASAREQVAVIIEDEQRGG